MYAVTIKEYGNETKLKLELDVTAPQPNANQVMVEVKASSVNPIDLMKRSGYGKAVFEKQRKILFPWILGSDFSGNVVSVGSKVTKFNIKDERAVEKHISLDIGAEEMHPHPLAPLEYL